VFAAPDKRDTVGIDVSLTGAGAEDAILVKNGASLAIDEANAQGGMAGYHIDAMVLAISVFQANETSQHPVDDVLHQYKYLGVAPQSA